MNFQSLRVRCGLWLGTAALVLLAAAACRQPATTGPRDQNSSPIANVASTPPYSTKEPERYRALSVVTIVEDQKQTSGSRIFVARDGNRRREDYDDGDGPGLSYLQTPEGLFLISPSLKLYSEIKPEDNRIPNDPVVRSVLSPNRLLNDSRPEIRYEKLGPAELNGRAVTKYRITSRALVGDAKNVVTETIAWIDESLGLRIRSETTSINGGIRSETIVHELRDISTDVDPALFVIPPDFRKVASTDILPRRRDGP